MKIIVVGGGIGGLALAAGLKKQGFEVTVIEKDTDIRATGGYHITLHKDVQDALYELLPSENLARILASAADGKRRDPDVFWDWRGRRFWSMKPLEDPGIDIDRISLRVLLAEAARDTLMLGRRFVSYEIINEKIIATLDDGSLLTGDLLVGCDGTQSTVVKQLVGRSTNTPTGIVGISGRTPVSKLNSDLRAKLGTRSSMAMGPGGIALYFGYFDPVNHSVINRTEIRASITKEATYIWGAMFPESDEIQKLKDKKNAALQLATVDIMKRNGWSAELLNVISTSNLDDIAIYRFNAASSNSEDLAPWNSAHIVVLGDAVHATPPTAGMGAGIAIRDAEDLVTELMNVRKGEKSLNTALREFEGRMRIRGSKAIVAALAIIKFIKFTDTPVGRVLTKILLPVMAAFSKIFGKP